MTTSQPDLQSFYLSALNLGYISKAAKQHLGWNTAKGKTQAQLNEALTALAAVRPGDFAGGAS